VEARTDHEFSPATKMGIAAGRNDKHSGPRIQGNARFSGQ
jgi:hypothetical protein